MDNLPFVFSLATLVLEIVVFFDARGARTAPTGSARQIRVCTVVQLSAVIAEARCETGARQRLLISQAIGMLNFVLDLGNSPAARTILASVRSRYSLAVGCMARNPRLPTAAEILQTEAVNLLSETLCLI